ncbi:DUF2637 domain-containing protein [Streptomyces actuosus]|uniref:DUF2637 domain-containing protein n=1 Tax=Streptomyces actuosus TaxID=1885 RepID=A0ABS2VU02_STRAS|nr:DUF2637 domain-containing protein [Streptomyces actuosus]MBN0046577.1 DUF2637 domain-containing protein [Streptomyces actuosus]
MHRILIGVVVTGAVIIAGIGFAGSYAAVRELAVKKGFGNFSYVFPIGIDAGICVLLALDLLLTWIRIPFPLLRQTAWVLTAATIAFNGAAAWPDPLGVGMHAVIPVLFVVSVEAARHAIGRIADITADKHMEGVRLMRWLLSPIPTFLLWRRMKLWELRSYDQVIKLEQERLVYQARLRSRFGRAWRRKAPVESLMPLRLAKYGVPLAQTAGAGLAAAGIDPVLLPPAAQRDALGAAAADDRASGVAPAGGQNAAVGARAALGGAPAGERRPQPAGGPGAGMPPPGFEDLPPEPDDERSPWFNTPRQVEYHGNYDPSFDTSYADPSYTPEEQYEQWYEEQYPQDPAQADFSPEQTGSFPIPVVPGGRTRELGDGGGSPAPEPTEEDYYQVFRQSINGSYPTPRELIDNVQAEFGRDLPADEAKRMVMRFQNRHTAELEEDHIA